MLAPLRSGPQPLRVGDRGQHQVPRQWVELFDRRIEESQFRSEAVGVRKPKGIDVVTGAWDKNRRVEFTINKVAVKGSAAAGELGGGVNPEEFRLVK